ncbi:MAG: hypothetical protein AAFU85_20815 [Planctomycetota bacterium]
MARSEENRWLGKSITPLALLLGFGTGLVASVQATAPAGGVVSPDIACADCQAEQLALQIAQANFDIAEAALDAAEAAYDDCLENNGGSGPPRLNDSGESILVTE